LAPVAIDSDVVSSQGLADHIGNDTAIVRTHARSVGVEDSCNADIHALGSRRVESESLGCTLALVITGTWPRRIDIAPVILWLRMDLWVAIDLARGSKQETCSACFCKVKKIMCAHDTGQESVLRMGLIVHR
jgi:hypothetical protein